MKPDFALDFRDNQISLLHDADGVWAVIGRVAMDDPDLDAAMGYLRATALGLSPRGIATKLIVPNDAILYTQLTDLPFDPARRAQRIAEGLVGRTPYDVADLVYDWTDAGDSAHLAVIARETLAEAEGFAAQHRFNPISFAALPDQGGFEGEVWFGSTQLSETLLSKGDVVERDDVVVFAPAADAPADAPLAASDFEMGAGVDEGDALIAAQADEAEQPSVNPVAPEEDFVEPDLPEPDLPEPDAAIEVLAGDAPEPAALDNADLALQEPAVAGAQDGPADGGEGDDATGAAEPVPQDLAEVAAPDQPDLFAGTDVQGDPPAEADPLAVLDDLAAAQPGVIEADAPEAEVIEAGQIEADPIETGDEAPMAIDVPLIDDPLPNDGLAAAAQKKPSRSDFLLSAFQARRAAFRAKTDAAASPARAEPALTAPKDSAASSEMPNGETSAPSDLGTATDAAPLLPPKLGSAMGDAGTARPVFAPAALNRAPDMALTAAKPQHPRPQSLKKPAPARRGGGVKLGWVLTVALIISLMVAAALSSYLIEAVNKYRASTSELAAAQGADADVAPAPAPKIPAGATLAVAPIVRDPASQPAAPTSVLMLSSRAEGSAVLVPALAMRPAPRPARGTDAVQGAPQDLVLAKLPDSVLPLIDIPAATDLTAIAKPSLSPAPRPQTVLDAAKLADPAQAGPAQAGPAQAGTASGDSALGKARPAPRPQSVLQTATAAAPAPSSLPAAVGSDPALAAARPLPRPASVSNLAANTAVTPTTDPLAADAPAPLARPDPNRSKLAVTISPSPAFRPKGLKAAYEQKQAAALAEAAAKAAAEADAAAVAAAVAAAAKAEPPAPKAPAKAAPKEVAAAEEEAEEEVTRSSGNSTRSIVDRQATMKNVLNLSNLNLVGIFGSSANRYALIRQPNGSVKKIKVGDRLNGGRVAAITESEVRYDKGGELQALTMPRG